MTQGSVFLVGEDALCCALGSALVTQSGIDVELAPPRKAGGADPFRKQIARMNQVARHTPVLMLADGDKADCVVTQLRQWLPTPVQSGLVLRLAVRESESWILADRTAFAEFAGISVAKVPSRPDELPDPKQYLLNLIAKGKRRALKEEMLPGKDSRARIGLGYNLHLEAFVKSRWHIQRAAENSPSLARAIPRVQQLLDTAT